MRTQQGPQHLQLRRLPTELNIFGSLTIQDVSFVKMNLDIDRVVKKYRSGRTEITRSCFLTLSSREEYACLGYKN